MLEKFYPGEYLDSTYVIDFDRLYEEGYRGIIFDIDNTLVPHGAPADERACALFAHLKELGFQCMLLSNNKEPRVKLFNDVVHVSYIYKAGKPKPGNYRKAMQEMGTDTTNTIFIGDQIFTDVYGANLAGKMKIAIGNDHAATELKFIIMDYVKSLGHEVVNFGTDGNESCNYPEFGEKVGRAVVNGEADCGILICGTGVGISIAANKVNGVRAAVCSDCATARLVKEHNNANIIAFGARIVGSELAKDIVKAYLDAEFQGGRHQTRIDMIHEIETRN